MDSLKIWGLLFVFLSIGNLHAQDEQLSRWQCSAGFNALIYQSRYAFDSSTGFEVKAGRTFKQKYLGEAGIRLGTNDLKPEAFIRFGIMQKFGNWCPSFSIENGISKRADFNDQTLLLKDSRDAMVGNIGYGYLSSHTELLCFELKNKWLLSFLELDFGTHYREMGKTLRLQLNIARIGVQF